jgi:hypothetical protein
LLSGPGSRLEGPVEKCGLSDAKGLKHRIPGVRIEPSLEFREKLTGNRRDVFHAGHRQQNALGAGVKSHLKGFRQVLYWHNIPSEAHAAQDNHLRLDRLAQRSGAQRHKRRQRHGSGRSGIVELDDMKVVVVVAALDGGADPVDVCLEVVEPNLNALSGARVGSKAGRLQRAVSRSNLRLQAVETEMPA